MQKSQPEVVLSLTHDEALTLYGASFYVTGGFGPLDPNRPGFTAQVKLAKLLDIPSDG